MKNKITQNEKFIKGFTLIELLVVVVIIGILAAIALPQYKMAVLKTKLARAKSTTNDIKKAYELYYTVHNEYPTKFSDLDFAYDLSDSNIMQTPDYYCMMSTSYKELYCTVNNGDYKISYFISYASSEAKILCRAWSTNKSDIYNKLCQQETKKTAQQASCIGTSYCNYRY